MNYCNTRNYFLLCSVITLLLFFSKVSIAQPTISNINFPEIGDSITQRVLDPEAFIIDNGGANVVWDYSNAPQETLSASTKFVEPTNTPYSSDFPDADLAGVSEDGFSTYYQYYNIEDDRFEFYGIAFNTPNGIYKIQYTDPELILITPSTFLTSDSELFAADIDSGLLGIERTGSLNYEVDAYGTLLLPNNITYENVIRIKIDKTYEDVFEVYGMPFSQNSTVLNYLFWSADHQFLVANYSAITTIDVNGENTEIDFTYISDSQIITSTVSEVNDYQLNLFIHNGAINWSSDEVIEHLSVWSVDGKLIQQEQVESLDGKIPFKGKSNTVYIVKTQYANGKSGSILTIAK